MTKEGALRNRRGKDRERRVGHLCHDLEKGDLAFRLTQRDCPFDLAFVVVGMTPGLFYATRDRLAYLTAPFTYASGAASLSDSVVCLGKLRNAKVLFRLAKAAGVSFVQIKKDKTEARKAGEDWVTGKWLADAVQQRDRTRQRRVDRVPAEEKRRGTP